jgi:hypothetical protein
LGTLLDPDGEGPLTPEIGALRLINMINMYIGRDDQFVSEPDEHDDYAIVVVGPETDSTIITSQEDAAVKIAPGLIHAQTLLRLIRQDQVTLNTPLPAKSKVFDLSMTPEVPFDSLVIAICPDPNLSPAQRAKLILYHFFSYEPDSDYEELQQVDPPAGLTCDAQPHSQASSHKGFRGWLASLGHRAVQLITPKNAYAGHAAIAGTVKDFTSPFVIGGPDQLETSLSLTLPDPSLVFGYDAPISATLMAGTSPVAGESISLAVDGVSQAAATTGSSGVAYWSYAQPRVGDIPVAAAFAETDDYLASEASGTLRVRYTTSPGRSFTTPIPNSKYGRNRTIPFKFQLYRWTADGFVTYGGATATLRACRVTNGSCTPVSLSDAARTFRYSDTQYILNFEAKLLEGTGEYRFWAQLDDLTEIGPMQIEVN